MIVEEKHKDPAAARPPNKKQTHYTYGEPFKTLAYQEKKEKVLKEYGQEVKQRPKKDSFLLFA